MKQKLISLVPPVLILIFNPSLTLANIVQIDIEELKKTAPKVFIDCQRCDIDYIRQELNFVNYVWDRQEADVHVLITTQRTGGGGREYTLSFIGRQEFQQLQNVLKYYASMNDTEEEIRRGLVKMLKMGLAPYVACTPMSEMLSIDADQKSKPTSVKDKWNFWVFNISMRSRVNGESQRKSIFLSGNISANRVTPSSKFRLGFDFDYNKDEYDYEDEFYSSTSKGRDLNLLYVKSINEHWSTGAWLSVSHSTYRNIDMSYSVHPAVEYNFFPYSQSTRRQLRLLYKMGYNYFKYLEETIYGKLSQRLFNQSLTATLALRETWGSVEISLEGSHYFHDLSKNRILLFGDLNIRIFKGLSLNLFGRYAAVRDQLSLPRGETSLEEILLRRKELATDYDYFASIGISYSFGSIFSNVVNPRFGGGGQGEGRRWH